MSKYRRLRDALVADSEFPTANLLVPERATREDLLLAHEHDYVDAVLAGEIDQRMQRRIGFPWSEPMVERSRRSVGGTIGAAKLALRDQIAVNLAGGTHHAFANRGGGFCVFNDVVVAARRLLVDNDISRALVIDLDVHQGDGTAAIAAADPSIVTFSMHGATNYPARKMTSDLDIALPDGCGDDDYLAKLSDHLPDLIDTHQPDFAFYLAGADPFHADRYGKLALSFAGLAARDALVIQTCLSARLPLAIVMAGGYAANVDDIVAIHYGTVMMAFRSLKRLADAKRHSNHEWTGTEHASPGR